MSSIKHTELALNKRILMCGCINLVIGIITNNSNKMLKDQDGPIVGKLQYYKVVDILNKSSVEILTLIIHNMTQFYQRKPQTKKSK